MTQMGRATAIVLGVGLGLASMQVVAAPATPDPSMRAHYRDYSVNAERDMPIVCKPGDVQPFDGRTMAEVFGDAWPQQPEPINASSHQPAQLQTALRLSPPRGLESQTGAVMLAVLVDATGKVIADEPVCMTSGKYAIAARRAIRGARFSPAIVNGAPVTSVVVPALMFRPGRRGGGGQPSAEQPGG